MRACLSPAREVSLEADKCFESTDTPTPTQPTSSKLLSRHTNGGIQQGRICYDDATRPGYVAHELTDGVAA
jgi:hypothetical protein